MPLKTPTDARAPAHLCWEGDGDVTPAGFVAGPNVCVSKEPFLSPSPLKRSILKAEEPFQLGGYHGRERI